ncbi:hypothetical protein NC651_025546 [Populus alba x Populus x berolinensis]|nr:hypothetical protein NC651_025546 [Populus alba x Populus x berolinensis]
MIPATHPFLHFRDQSKKNPVRKNKSKSQSATGLLLFHLQFHHYICNKTKIKNCIEE